MYHIFIAIALNATQNQVSAVKKYYNDQVNHEIGHKERANNSLIPSYPSQPNSRADVLEQFKKELNQEDETINKLAKADLESMGLDPVDSSSKKEEEKSDSDNEFASSVGQLDQKIDIEKIPVEETSEINGKAAEFAALANKFSAEQKKLESIKTQAALEKQNFNNQDVKNKIENAAKISEQELNKLDKEIISNDKKDETPPKKVEEVVKKEADKEENKEVSNKPVESVETKINQMIDKLKNSVAIDDKSKTPDAPTDKEIVKNEDNNKKIEKPKTKKELALEKKMKAEEAREEKKLEKLNKLRDKYLAKLESDEVSSDISEYQKISKIVPEQKVLPKYISYEIPPQL